MNDEIWKEVEGYARYEVSNTGKVASKERTVKGRFSFVTRKRKVLSQFLRSGYPSVELYSAPKKRFSESVHRIIAKAFVENPGNKGFVNHINGNREDNSIENLEWVTASENIKHSYDVLKRKSPIELLRIKDPNLTKHREATTIANRKRAREFLKKHEGKDETSLPSV